MGLFFKRRTRVRRKDSALDDFARGFLIFGNVSFSLSYWDILWQSDFVKKEYFFLWCLEWGACKNEVEMLQNKQGHIKKPNCLSLFFFINCDFVLNLGEKCIWEWRGKWSCFLVIIFLMRERSDLDALPSVAVLFSSGLSMLCGTNVPHQCFSLVIGHYGKRKKTSVLMGANPCSATIYLQFSWLTYLWHLFIFQEFRTINTDFFFFFEGNIKTDWPFWYGKWLPLGEINFCVHQSSRPIYGLFCMGCCVLRVCLSASGERRAQGK